MVPEPESGRLRGAVQLFVPCPVDRSEHRARPRIDVEHVHLGRRGLVPVDEAHLPRIQRRPVPQHLAVAALDVVVVEPVEEAGVAKRGVDDPDERLRGDWLALVQQWERLRASGAEAQEDPS